MAGRLRGREKEAKEQEEARGWEGCGWWREVEEERRAGRKVAGRI